MKTNSERGLNVSNNYNKSNKMTDYYRNDKRKYSSSSESTITVKDKYRDKRYNNNSYRKSYYTSGKYRDYKDDYYRNDREYNRDNSKSKEIYGDKDVYKNSYRDKYRDNDTYSDRYRERERYSPYYPKYYKKSGSRTNT